MLKIKHHSTWVVLVTIIFILAITTGCAQTYVNHKTNGGSETKPVNGNKDIQIVVKIGDRSSTIIFAEPDKLGGRLKPIVLDQNGNEVTPCTLCSEALEEKFGPGCEGAERKYINICQNLVDTTVGEIHTITVIKSRRCGTTIIDGYHIPLC